MDSPVPLSVTTSSELHYGAKIGIAAGIVIVAIIGVFVFHRLYMRWRNQNSRAHSRDLRGRWRPL